MSRLDELRAHAAALPKPLSCDLDVYDEEVLEIRAGVFDMPIRLLFTSDTGFTNKSSAEWDSARQSDAYKQAQAIAAIVNVFPALLDVLDAIEIEEGEAVAVKWTPLRGALARIGLVTDVIGDEKR